MKISLTPELERIVTANIASGRFKEPRDVISAGLHLLEDAERRRVEVERLRAAIQVGVDQAERGEVVDGAVAMREILDRLRRAKSKPKRR